MDKISKGENNEGTNLNRKNVDERLTAKPPDGGWGWVVVFSSLMCNILVDGIGLAYGVLLPKFAEYFQTSKSKVSLVGSLLIGMYLCAGIMFYFYSSFNFLEIPLILKSFLSFYF